MKITKKLIDNLNESNESQPVINIINNLIVDEEEAIKGYIDAIGTLFYELNDEKNKIVEETLNHIKEEEEEHIRELHTLLAKLLN